jgi:hypothetical protein
MAVASVPEQQTLVPSQCHCGVVELEDLGDDYMQELLRISTELDYYYWFVATCQVIRKKRAAWPSSPLASQRTPAVSTANPMPQHRDQPAEPNRNLGKILD